MFQSVQDQYEMHRRNRTVYFICYNNRSMFQSVQDQHEMHRRNRTVYFICYNNTSMFQSVQDRYEMHRRVQHGVFVSTRTSHCRGTRGGGQTHLPISVWRQGVPSRSVFSRWKLQHSLVSHRILAVIFIFRSKFSISSWSLNGFLTDWNNFKMIAKWSEFFHKKIV
jgi:ribosomal protein L36